jgi:hypothetical protein
MNAITLRFVTSNAEASRLIRLQAGICMPFTPSHVEALSPDGKFYIGQHIEDGMRARPIGYDAADMLAEKLVALSCTDAQHDSFYGYCERRIGAPYDWQSILSFVDPALNLHDFGHLICSGEMTAGLRAAPAPYFPYPLTVPFHHISPRDLFLMLSGHVEISH